MSRDLVAGVDSSTQSCTIVLRRLEDGAFVVQARRLHPPTTPPLSEQPPKAWWQAFKGVLDDLADYVPRIAAISIGGQGHGLVMLDEDGTALRDAKLWNDTQSAPDAMRLREMFTPREWVRRTGSLPAPALTLSKLAWTQRHYPELLKRLRHILLPSGYLLFSLTGRAVTERGDASGTGYFNPFENRWEPQLASLAVPDMDWQCVLPDIVDSSAAVGLVKNVAELEGVVAGAGTGDNMAAALGLVPRSGDVVMSFGTSGTVYGRTKTGVYDESGVVNGYADAADAFLPMVTVLNCAKVLDAFRRVLNVDIHTFNALALESEPGAGGCVLVPYLDGERTPNLPDVTGMLLGLRSDVTQGQIARAVVEGVLCNMLEGWEHLKRNGLEDKGRLIITGGASRSSACRQILADLSGREIWSCDVVETAAAGAAVQAAAALTGRKTIDIAQEWQPDYQCVAEPSEKAYQQAESIRAVYREKTKSYNLGMG